MDIKDSAALHLTTGMTLEAWVNPSTVSNAWQDVIYKGNDNYYLEGSSPQAGVPAMGGTFTPSPLYGKTALKANTWTHLAATYDGATMRLYVNGVQVASRAQTGTMTTSTKPLQLGGDSIFGQYFAGTIDEVRVYNVALTAAQIQSDMTLPVSTAYNVTISLSYAPAARLAQVSGDPIITCAVQDIAGQAVPSQTVSVQKASALNGTYTNSMSKKTNVKGQARLAYARPKKSQYVRCSAAGHVSLSKMITGSAATTARR